MAPTTSSGTCPTSSTASAGWPPTPTGWDGIHHRLEARRRVRARARVAGVAVALVAMVAVLIPLAGGGDRPTQVASDPQAFPRLVLDLPGYELVHADSSEDVAPREDTGQLLVYGDAGPGLLGTGAVVSVRLVPAGAPYGIGENDSNVRVDIGGREGRLLDYGSLTTSLGWPRADGTLVHIVAAGVADDPLVNMARSIEAAMTEGRGPLTALGDGLTLRRTGSLDTGPSNHGEVAYTGPENRTVDLRLTSGGPTSLDDLVVRPAGVGRLLDPAHRRRPAGGGEHLHGRSRGGAADPGGDVGGPSRRRGRAGHPGPVRRRDRNGAGLDQGDRRGRVGGTGRQVQGCQRADIRLGFAPTPRLPRQTSRPTPCSIAEMCKASYAWLHAVEVGDAGGRVTMTADLHSLRDKGEAAGLGNDSDIILIADRIVAAADAGDADAVRAERSMCP